MNRTYKPAEFASLVGRTPQTLRLWDKKGLLSAKRTPGNQRYYTDADLQKALNLDIKEVDKQVIVYGRVSSPKQKKDLQRQIDSLEAFTVARGLAISKTIQEVGGGLNYTRPKFLELMALIESRSISHLIVAHKDRLCRFGFEYFQHFCLSHQCELIIANQSEMSPQQELMEDLMAVIHTFSCRLYGMRKYKKELEEIIQKASSESDDSI
jgi:putative resolvase